jgi:hypothetical protein
MVWSPSYRNNTLGIPVWKVLSHKTTKHHCARGSILVDIVVWSPTIDGVKLPTINRIASYRGVLPLSPHILFPYMTFSPRLSAGSIQPDELRKYFQ